MQWTPRRLFIVILFIGLLLMTIRPIADPDFWWHLSTGKLISQTHIIPHSDPFSFTSFGKTWITHEWLAELFFYGLFRLGSYALLIATFSIIITAAFLFVYLRCPAESKPYVAGFSLLLGALATAPTWGVRPQMISLFLTSLFLYLLDQFLKSGRLKFILALPVLTLLWVNLHAGFLLGLAIVGIYILGSGIEAIVANGLRNRTALFQALRPLLTLTAILAACLLATLANPNGVRILIYPFQTLTSPSMQQLIQEWFSPDFHLLEWQPLAWLILLLIGAGMIGKKPISITNILLVLILGYAGLRSMRNVPLFALVAIPVLTEQISSFVRISSDSRASARLFQWISIVLVACAILVAGLRLFQVNQSQSKTEAETFPAAAVSWIQENRPQGNLFNTYGWGGYLIWRLYPDYQVYIDGRADVYGDTFIYDFVRIQNADPGWETNLANQNVQTVLIEPGTPLANSLRISSGWKIEYEDSQSILFIHNY